MELQKLLSNDNFQSAVQADYSVWSESDNEPLRPKTVAADLPQIDPLVDTPEIEAPASLFNVQNEQNFNVLRVLRK